MAESCTCDQSGARTFCMHHLQDAFNALEAAKERYPDPLAATGFNGESLMEAVGDLLGDDVVEVAVESGVSLNDAVATLFVDGLMLGVLLAARAPRNHAEHVLAELGRRDGER